MARSDDLAGLLAPAAGPATGVRQGKVIAFDALTGASTVAVAGSVLTNLRRLDTGITPTAGDVVLLLRVRSSWLILGRIA